MNTHVAKFIAFNVLLNMTDLLAPNAKTHVINSVMPNAIKSGVRPTNVKCVEKATERITRITKRSYATFIQSFKLMLPKNVPITPAMLRPIAPPDSESNEALRAQAHALVPKIG